MFTDEAVHMLMVLLIIFDKEDKDKEVRDVHSLALNMLNRHLRSEWGLAMSHCKVKLVLECVADLPKILPVFAAIF